jgi:hypothetical protein
MQRPFRLSVLLPIALLSACLPVPFLRRGPSEAHIEGARGSDRFIVKGRAPYLIVPRISRTSSLRLASGAVVRAEARDKVFAVTIRNDTGVELWVSSFDLKTGPVPVIVCRYGTPEPLKVPLHLLAGDETILLFRDDREHRDVRMILRSMLDRDDLTMRFDNGPPLSGGFVLVPFGLYDYIHLPRACRDAAMK